MKTFFGIYGNEPAKAHTIHCGESSMTIARTTQVGRIILTKALIKLSRNHSQGRSFNGQYTLDQILVNDKLDVDIAAQFYENPGRTSEQLDLLDLLMIYSQSIGLMARCLDILGVWSSP